jgi:hypothetical protein
MASWQIPTKYKTSMQPDSGPGATRAISDPTGGNENAIRFQTNCATAALEIQTAAANRDRLSGGGGGTGRSRSPARVAAIHITGAAFLRTIGKEGKVASIRRQQVSACLGCGAAVKCASTQLLLLLPPPPPTNQPTNQPVPRGRWYPRSVGRPVVLAVSECHWIYAHHHRG